MKTNIIVSVLRVKGYWHLLVKYTENGQPIRYQMSTSISTDQPLQKTELARRRMLSELYELNRMDALCEKWDLSPDMRYQPVSNWLNHWLSERCESIAERTHDRYAIIVHHACQFFDEKELTLYSVSPLALEEYRDAMLAYGYSSRTIQAHFVLLRAAFDAACHCGLNRSNPICGVQLPHV